MSAANAALCLILPAPWAHWAGGAELGQPGKLSASAAEPELSCNNLGAAEWSVVISQLGVGKSTVPLPGAVILFCSSFPFPLSECHRLLHCCARLLAGGVKGEERNLASTSQAASITDDPVGAQELESGRDRWKNPSFGNYPPAKACEHLRILLATSISFNPML